MLKGYKNRYLFIIILVGILFGFIRRNNVTEMTIGFGWAKNAVNAAVFRKNSVVSDGHYQYASYYDSTGFMVLAKRKLRSRNWQVTQTPYKGNVNDAHNIISMMVDGDGYLHVAWDHHGNPLRYARSKSPGSLDLTEKLPMAGLEENYVTYPEFYKMPNGDLLFLYRSGASGRGNLLLNRYILKEKKWQQVHPVIIDGEGQRNAYWQTAIDNKGTIHLSWVWRETGDVATNHDMGYAKSDDGGETWIKSTGEKYTLPITLATAEYAVKIPQKSELINQTSMCTDAQGRPYIATYWRPTGTRVPQYHIIYHNGKSWQTHQVSDRKTAFSLSGGGTKKIPISRPQIMTRINGTKTGAYLVFRDEERGNRVSISICQDLKRAKWKTQDLTNYTVGNWEPSYDTELWQQQNILNLFVQNVGQGDGEKLENIAPQPVWVLEWKP